MSELPLQMCYRLWTQHQLFLISRQSSHHNSIPPMWGHAKEWPRCSWLAYWRRILSRNRLRCRRGTSQRSQCRRDRPGKRKSSCTYHQALVSTRKRQAELTLCSRAQKLLKLALLIHLIFFLHLPLLKLTRKMFDCQVRLTMCQLFDFILQIVR